MDLFSPIPNLGYCDILEFGGTYYADDICLPATIEYNVDNIFWYGVDYIEATSTGTWSNSLISSLPGGNHSIQIRISDSCSNIFYYGLFPFLVSPNSLTDY